MKVGNSVRTPRSACLGCGEVNDAATGVGDNARPRPGDVTVCLYCGHVMAFDKKLRMRELTDEEMIEVAGDERIVAINRARSAIGKS